jgi:hypothetical protein
MFLGIEALPHLQSLRSLRLALKGAQRVSQSATNSSDSLVERSHEFVHSVSLLVNAANDNFTTPNRTFASEITASLRLCLSPPQPNVRRGRQWTVVQKCVVAIVHIMYDPPSAYPRSRLARPYNYCAIARPCNSQWQSATVVVCSEHTYCDLATDPCRSLPIPAE